MRTGLERSTALELMDDPDVDPHELAGNFRDIERANRFFGGSAPVVRAVLARDATSVLDVGCGSGDVLRAVVAAARRRGRAIFGTGLDASGAVVAIARERTATEPRIRYLEGNAGALPFGDRAFDIATCNLALHHFDVPFAVAALRELRRVARVTPLVCDLVRSPFAYAAAVAYTRLAATNRLTRHDGPLSVRRAYTPVEAVELARRAGWNDPHAVALPWFRMMVVDRG